MNSNLYSISKKDLFDLLGRLASENRVLVPYAKGDNLYFDDFDHKREDSIELSLIRQSQPLKSFINPVRERVMGAVKERRPRVIAGVKSCDLSSLLLQDFVFQEGEVVDPLYSENRTKTTIIASDCTSPKETCFCVSAGGVPHPTKFFDLSLSPIDNHFLVEVGSPKGQKIVDGFKTFFKSPSSQASDTRGALRDRIAKQVQGFIDKRGTPNTDQIKGSVKKNYYLTEFWQDMASTCIECGACNLVCPTCHCFLLVDEKDALCARRFKSWDACLYNTFARVTGNQNPRRHLYERLRNRFDKKFEFFPQVLNYFACTGCGRCIEACPGDIDVREVLKGLVSGTRSKPPHD